MTRRRSKRRSALLIFQWLFKSIAIVLGIPQLSPRTRRIATQRSGSAALRSHNGLRRRTKQKHLRTRDAASRSVVDFNNGCELSTSACFLSIQWRKLRDVLHAQYPMILSGYPSPFSQPVSVAMVTDIKYRRESMLLDSIERLYRIEVSNTNNNNNNRTLAAEDEQRRIVCFQVDSDQIVSRLERLLADNASILKHMRIVDFRELVAIVRSTAVHSTQEDASTMTTLDANCDRQSSCLGFISQSDDARRLKALEFIRLFLEKGKEEFCRHLVDEEHLCQRKTIAVYQMIGQFLDIVSRTEHGKK